jgi:hypothetical protein
VIGELLAAACNDASVLARLGGPFGEAARDAADELAALPAADARAWRIRLLTALRAPIPPGFRGVHPSWVEAGLVGLPARARAALAVSSPDPIDIFLARWACAAIPPLPSIDPALRVPSSIDEAVRLTGDALAAWLAEVGADQLAHALASQPDALRTLARTVGDRLLAAAARITQPPRAGALGPTRDAIARCRGDARSDLLIRIGARTIAPHTDPLTRRQLAVRLPHTLGLALLAELVTHASSPLDRGPTWAALAG